MTKEHWDDAGWVESFLISSAKYLGADGMIAAKWTAKTIASAFSAQAKRYNSGKTMYDQGFKVFIKI